jgi:hypothetical protein
VSKRDVFRSLTKARVKAVPVWMILLVCIGTAAGAFILISNTIHGDVTPQEYPIMITGSFTESPYIDEAIEQSFTYTINDNTQDVGYLVLEFRSFSVEIGPTNFTITNVEVWPGSSVINCVEYSITNTDPYTLVYVFEDSVGSTAIDFGESDTYTSGAILFSFTYHTTTPVGVDLYVSSTSS